jgi:protein-disulfide isomerase
MVVHPQQVAVAHLVACAAAKQGKFKEFYTAFWKNGFEAYQTQRDPSLLAEHNVFKIAGEVGVNPTRMQADISSCQKVIADDEAELRKFKVNGTPSFFINGEFIGGGLPKEGFKQIIDQKLAIAERSGVPGAQYYDKEIRGKGEKSVERRDKRGGARPAAPPGR